jgi:ribosomal protein S6
LAETENTAVYEGLFIFDSNKFARDRDSLSQEVEKLVEDVDGEILVSRLWEERRLAYPVDGHRKGTYWLTSSARWARKSSPGCGLASDLSPSDGPPRTLSSGNSRHRSGLKSNFRLPEPPTP